MREMGGYIELERFHGAMFHEGLLALNCGRSCLRYLIRARKIQKIALPIFCCDAVRDACQKEGVAIRQFSIEEDWMPKYFDLGKGEWLYIVNAYGQLTQKQIQALKARYGQIIFDEAQAYFEEPLTGIDTIYTCRKFYGVSDGAFLATDAPQLEELPQDESHERMHFLLGRFERPASEFYQEYVSNNVFFDDEGIKQMSLLTENILRGADDDFIRARRKENFLILDEALHNRNMLKLRVPDGAFAYPLMIPHGDEVRKKLIARRIYIPMLWPNVLEDASKGSWERELARNILPLPVDQRYDVQDMAWLVEEVNHCIG